MSRSSEAVAAVAPPPGWRFRFGLLFFVLCWTSPPVRTACGVADLPLGWKTTMSGALVVGGPEVFGLIAIACLGKRGFSYLTQKVKALFKRYGPPRESAGPGTSLDWSCCSAPSRSRTLRSTCWPAGPRA